jgi:hypothetical protein
LFTVLDVDEDQFEAACNQFVQYDDQTITLVDHLSGVLADSKDTSSRSIRTTSGRWASLPFRTISTVEGADCFEPPNESRAERRYSCCSV